MPETSITLIGNWKMNLAPSEAKNFSRSLRENLPPLTHTNVWVTPPAMSAAHVVRELAGSPIKVGAQNVHWAASGAFTGETAPAFATDLGLTFSLVGHSERRTLFGDTSEQVAKRMKAALDAGLIPVVCIGETDSERASGRTEAVITSQLAPVFAHISEAEAERVIVAYEPVWAIGTGKVASEGEIRETHAYIKRLWTEQRHKVSCKVLYGGSVNPQNFAGIIALDEVDGALVGGASIKLDQWLALIEIAESARK